MIGLAALVAIVFLIGDPRQTGSVVGNAERHGSITQSMAFLYPCCRLQCVAFPDTACNTLYHSHPHLRSRKYHWLPPPMRSCPWPHTSTRNEAAAARTKLHNATGSELYMYVCMYGPTCRRIKQDVLTSNNRRQMSDKQAFKV